MAYSRSFVGVVLDLCPLSLLCMILPKEGFLKDRFPKCIDLEDGELLGFFFCCLTL